MTSCANCRAEIIFGGIVVGTLRFCGKRCQEKYKDYERELEQVAATY